MAIDLSEGEYALQQNTSNIQIIQLKLTDSALRAVESYQNLQGDRVSKPTIRFNGNQGSIRIPTDGGNDTQTFTFQLSALNQSAAIDGVQQYYTGDTRGRISIMGAIQHKITVNANDESYNATRKRMTLVKEQEQKTSTKEIKQPSSSKLGKKKLVNRRIRDQHLNNVRTSTPPPGRPTNNTSFARSASPLTTAPNRSVSPVTGSVSEAGIRNKTKPILSSFASSSSQPTTAQSGGKPLSERVTHYLALRPLKFQELMIRLSRDQGQPDAAKLRGILQQVAASRTVGMGVQEFVLNKQLLNEVHADWPGYTEEERVQVRRKLAEFTIKSSENRKRPAGGTPETATRDTPNTSPQSKNEDYTNPLRKKQRVSLYQKTSPSGPRSVSPLETSGMLSLSSTVAPAIISGKIAQLKEEETPSASFDRNSSPKKKNADENQRPGSANSRSSKPSPKPMARLSPKKPDPDVSPSKNSSLNTSTQRRSDQTRRANPPKQANEQNRANDSFAAFENQEAILDTSRNNPNKTQDEFLKKYKVIEGSDQRNKYRQDFSAEYKEYLLLYAKVAAEAKRFAEWQMQLKEQKEGTDQYKVIQRRVLHEYSKLKENAEYWKDRTRMQYLHRKLKHIKELVLQYDSRQAEIDRPRDSRREKRSRVPASDDDDDDPRAHAHNRSANVVRKRPVLTA
uniref:RNA polymerase II elongation factor ELL isoform X1 n=1 Tax=Ciona intestinalis TaxID=7719 RepID=UPI000180C6D7|nr:RNA polymerase II elongation factor ELL isoform X1 [Ciona intestinalis]|eukprot:XP_002128540.1 RNA polymerase II elongation factor ELL isoform X1 [Ciona intestinalis]